MTSGTLVIMHRNRDLRNFAIVRTPESSTRIIKAWSPALSTGVHLSKSHQAHHLPTHDPGRGEAAGRTHLRFPLNGGILPPHTEEDKPGRSASDPGAGQDKGDDAAAIHTIALPVGVGP